jgi:hypothetical protein
MGRILGIILQDATRKTLARQHPMRLGKSEEKKKKKGPVP